MTSRQTILRAAAWLLAIAGAASASADEPSVPAPRVPRPSVPVPSAPVPTAPRTAEADGRSAAVRRPQWELAFDDFISADEYAQQLDAFKIEIAAVASDGKVEYISNIRQRRPDKRSGELTTDSRIWIGWKRGTLEAIDRRLLSHAGINVKNKQIVHFFPEGVQKRMASIERAYARRDTSEIKRTRFHIERNAANDGYEFVVTEQDPPRPAGTQPASRSQNRPGRPE